MSRPALLVFVLALAGWSSAFAAPALGAGWRLPVAGGRDAVVAGRFAFDPAQPYAAGARRGVDLRARPGRRVVAPCTGVVSFAGRVPGQGGALTVRCGALAATLLGLGRVAARRGAAVVRGAPVGVAGAQGRVRLGARRRGDRHGYVDPLRLLGGAARAPVALGRRRVGPPASPARPVRVPGARRVRARAPARAGVERTPAAAWVGAALLGCALGAGVTRRRAGRRVASATPCPSTSPRRSTT
jgi:hypothetical protein